MAIKGHYELSDVPRLMERGGWPALLGARAALLYAAETLIEESVCETRALRSEEQSNFDNYTAQIREINIKLAEYKRQANADASEYGTAANLPF